MPENNDDLRPSWVPEEKNPEFACSVMRGIDTTANSITGAKEYPDAPLRKVPLRKKMTVEQYIDGVAKGDRVTLSKAITLIESNAPKDFDKAQRVLQGLLPKTGKALRIGITGVPGAGKSTRPHPSPAALSSGIRHVCRTCLVNQTASFDHLHPKALWAASRENPVRLCSSVKLPAVMSSLSRPSVSASRRPRSAPWSISSCSSY